MAIKKVAYAALAATVTLGSLIGVSLGSAGTAAAADYGCVYSSPGVATSCIAPLKSRTRLYLRSGGVEWLPGGTLVEVTCYYTGSDATDWYWDHIDWDSQNGNEVGHVNDSQVNFDGLTPPEVGLRTC